MPRVSVVVISKDEPSLDATLTSLERQTGFHADAEIIVVDASGGRLDNIRRDHPTVKWLAYAPPGDVAVSIPHQRNVGVRASQSPIIAFTDAGCQPMDEWLGKLVGPIEQGAEQVTAGLILSPDGASIYDDDARMRAGSSYLEECPTGNLAFTRAAFDLVGGFDEAFEYGSDIDFSWRLRDAGFQLASVPDAVITHDWGSPRRRVKRSVVYGAARARLYLKHPARWRQAIRNDPSVIAYPLFLTGLPVTLRFRMYPLLLAIPLWRNRKHRPIAVLVDHLAYGAGAMTHVGLAGWDRYWRTRQG